MTEGGPQGPLFYLEDALDFELLIARIIAGCLRFSVDGKRYLIRQPGRLRRYKAQQVYQEALSEGLSEDLYSDEEIDALLRANGLWDDDRQKQIDTLNKDIEKLKIALFRSFFKSRERDFSRTALQTARIQLGSLHMQKNTYSSMGATGFAQVARTRYLVGSGLFCDNGRRVWKNDEFYKGNDSLLDDAVTAYSDAQISESAMRALARSDQWRSVWNCKDNTFDIFGKSAVDLTEEQRSLLSWSQLYDNVAEHPNPPHEDIIKDDDAFDGWLILQRKERERQRKEATAEAVLSGMKLPDSGEIFLVAETDEDLQNIESLNSPQAAAIKRERLAHIAKKGEVEEQHMPDSKREIMMMAQRTMPGK
jgi:hypothetical protein